VFDILWPAPLGVLLWNHTKQALNNMATLYIEKILVDKIDIDVITMTRNETCYKKILK
jgi:hypothetical protein